MELKGLKDGYNLIVTFDFNSTNSSTDEIKKLLTIELSIT